VEASSSSGSEHEAEECPALASLSWLIYDLICSYFPSTIVLLPLKSADPPFDEGCLLMFRNPLGFVAVADGT